MATQVFTANQTLTASQLNTLQSNDFNFTRNLQTGTSYTIQLSDRGKLLEFQNVGAITATIPAYSSVAFDVGDIIEVLNTSTGVVNFVGGSGVTISAANGVTSLEGQWHRATLVNRAENTWVIMGNTAQYIPDNSITASKIADGTIIAADIADGSVTSAKILDGTIVNADISASAAIELGKLADATIDEQASSYTLALTDKNKFIKMTSGSANTVTVPTNASVAFPVGSQIHIIQYGAGKTQILPVAGTPTIYGTPGQFLRAQYSSATLLKCDTNIWILMGDLSAS